MFFCHGPFYVLLMAVCHAVRVRTPVGTFIGYTSNTAGGTTYISFSGVRFSKPLTPEHRFKEADPVEPSEDVFNATHEGPKCLQFALLSLRNQIEGQEDCLYLNIYTPTIDGKLPVLVVIPQGFFQFLSASRYYIGPDYFMETGKVLVLSMNYRLGIFGFADFKSSEFPANLGLRDQVLALKWIQKYISYFGGDQNRVTLLGMSAGGACAHLHLLSPLSKGLFHAAISESGYATSSWSLNSDLQVWEQLKYVAKRTPCKKYMSLSWAEDNTAFAKCLRNMSGNSIVEAVFNFNIQNLNPVFLPTVDKGRNNSFLLRSPWLPSDSKIPWLSGVNNDEGVQISRPLLKKEVRPFLKYLSLLFFSQFKKRAMFDDKAADSLLVTRELIRHLFNVSQKVDENNIIAISKYGISFISFYYPHYESLLKYSGNKYSYIFGYKANYSEWKIKHPSEGISHGEEFEFLFRKQNKNIRKFGLPEDSDMTRIMVDLWTNFILYHDPTPAPWTSKYGKAIPKWLQWTPENNLILSVGQQDIKMKKDPFLNEYLFWENLPYHNRENS